MNLLIFAAMSLFSRDAAATIPDLVGEGPANIGMGSAGTALANDAYAPYYNPAGMTQLRRITLGAAPVTGQKCLATFDGIVRDMDGDGRIQDIQGYPEYGPVGMDGDGYDPTVGSPAECASYGDGIEFGLVVPFWRVAAFGISGYLPGDSLIHISLSDPAMPSYVMYGDRNRTFAFSPALALNPIQGVHLGVGFQLMANISASAQLSTVADISAFSTAEGSDAVSGGAHANVDSLEADIKPQMGLNWGLLVDASVFSRSRDPEVVTRLRRHAIAIAYKDVWQAGTSINAGVKVNGQIQFQDETLLLSSLVQEPIEVSLSDLVGFYNPNQMSFGFRTGFGDVRGADGTLDDMPRFLLTADAVLTGWGAFDDMVSPYMEQSFTTLEGVSMGVTVGEDYGDPNFHDTLSYRAGMQLAVGPFLQNEALKAMHMHLRLGGQYVPSPVPAQTGKTNYMDSDRVVGAAGIGFEADRLKPVKNLAPLFNGPISLDLGGQVHYLMARTTTKDADLLSDTNGDGIQDYGRGYPLGGQITSYGIYWAATAGLQFNLGDPQVRPRPVRGFKDGPVGEPQPNPEKIKAPRGAGGDAETEALAIPVDESGELAAGAEASRADKKEKKKAAKAAKAAEKAAEKAAKQAAEDGGIEPDAAPAELEDGAEAGDAADLDAPPAKEKKAKKEKKEKKSKKDKKSDDQALPEEAGAEPGLTDEPAGEATDEPSGETP